MSSLSIFIQDINKSSGGPAVSVTSVGDLLASYGYSPSIYCFDLTEPVACSTKTTLLSPLKLAKVVSRDRHSKVWINGMWDFGVLLLVALKIVFPSGPIFISPRGMLEPYSLRRRAWAKYSLLFLYRALFQVRNVTFIASGDLEYKSIKRAFGAAAKIKTIPNLVTPEKLRRPHHKKYKSILFLSRIHEKKGIRELLTAWTESVAMKHWTLNVVGEGSSNYVNELKKKFKDSSIVWHGAVYDERKYKFFLSNDLLILPTHSENFGNVVVEALRYSLPVAITRATPWSDLHAYGSGFLITNESHDICEFLTEFSRISDVELFEKKINAYNHAQIFSAEKLGFMYRKLFYE